MLLISSDDLIYIHDDISEEENNDNPSLNQL